MKGILLLVLVIASFSCNPRKATTNSSEGIYDATNPYGVEDSLLIEGEYLIFLSEEKFVPLMKTWTSALETDTMALVQIENERIAAIREFAKSYDVTVQDGDFYVHLFSGFYVKGINKNQLSRMLGDKVNVREAHQNFYMQNTRARMQSPGPPITQNTRARMQENPEWGYDVNGYTSKSVTYVRGEHIGAAPTTKIWIIDSGIERTHRDLAGLVVQNLSRSFVEGGFNPASDADPFNDFWGHGTFCAGLAAAKAANGTNPNKELIGMNGVSPGAKLVSLKVFGQDSESEYIWIARALEFASRGSRLTEGDVMSFSLGGKVNNCNRTELIRALNDLAELKKIFLVFAACNGTEFVGENANRFIPACIEGARIFTIGSVGLNYQTGAVSYSAFSNFGSPPIDWVMPGDFIFSTFRKNEYAVMQGTSMSTAMFAGLLHLTRGQVRQKTTVSGIHGETYTYKIPMK